MEEEIVNRLIDLLNDIREQAQDGLRVLEDFESYVDVVEFAYDTIEKIDELMEELEI